MNPDVKKNLLADLSFMGKVARDDFQFRDSILAWKRGQPLGLGPSFPMLALGNHFLLQTSGLTDFCVLGDDLAFIGNKDKLLYNFDQIGIETSPSKTITSDKVAEFAGYFITDRYILPSGKFRNVSDRSFLDLAKHIGPKIRSILPPRQRKIFDIVKDIPEEFGGLGFNPKGVSMMDRLSTKYGEIAFNCYLDKPLDSEITRIDPGEFFRRLSINISYKNNLPFELMKSELRRPASASDRISMEHGISNKVSTEVRSNMSPLNKPISDPRGPTTLDLMEKKFLPRKNTSKVKNTFGL
jgi:hypothetical protein